MPCDGPEYKNNGTTKTKIFLDNKWLYFILLFIVRKDIGDKMFYIWMSYKAVG